MGSDGNIMALQIYRGLFPSATKEQLVATTNKKTQLETYNRTIVTQLGIFKVKVEHNNKPEMCKFFVVPGSGKALLGIPHINTLNIITISCNTIDSKETDRAINYSTNIAIHQVQGMNNTIQT